MNALMHLIREAVPSLVEDEEYRGPLQEPAPKRRRTVGEDRQHHLAVEVSTCLHPTVNKHLINPKQYLKFCYIKHHLMVNDPTFHSRLL